MRTACGIKQDAAWEVACTIPVRAAKCQGPCSIKPSQPWHKTVVKCLKPTSKDSKRNNPLFEECSSKSYFFCFYVSRFFFRRWPGDQDLRKCAKPEEKTKDKREKKKRVQKKRARKTKKRKKQQHIDVCWIYFVCSILFFLLLLFVLLFLLCCSDWFCSLFF